MLKKLAVGISVTLFSFVVLQVGFMAFATTDAILENFSAQMAAMHGNQFDAPFIQSGSDIDIRTGAVDINRVDLHLPGINGLDVNIVRRFNSQTPDREFNYRRHNVRADILAEPMFWFTRSDTGTGIWVMFNLEQDVVDTLYVAPGVLNPPSRDRNARQYIRSAQATANGTVRLTRNVNTPPVRRMIQVGSNNIDTRSHQLVLNLGHNWQLDMPGILSDDFIDRTVPGGQAERTHTGRVKLPNGQVHLIRYRGSSSLNPSSRVEILGGVTDYTANSHFDRRWHSRGFYYHIRLVDSNGVQYFFEGSQPTIRQSSRMFLQAVIDNQGNMKRYHIVRDANNNIIGYDIIDTYNRTISVRTTGISVNGTEIVRYELGEIRDNVRDPQNLVRTINRRTLTVRRPEADGVWSDTQYIMQARQFRINSANNFFHFYNLERIVYPTGGHRVFEFENRAARRMRTPNGPASYTYNAYRVTSVFDYNNGEQQNRYTYTHTQSTAQTTAIQTRTFDNTRTAYVYDRFDRLTSITTTNPDANMMNRRQNFEYANYTDRTIGEVRLDRLNRTAALRRTRTYESPNATFTNRVSDVFTNSDRRGRPLYQRIEGGLEQRFVYDQRFMVLSRQYTQRDVNSWIRVRNTLAPGGRKIIRSTVYEGNNRNGPWMEVSHTEFDYDAQGRIIETRAFPTTNPSDVIRTTFQYHFLGDGAILINSTAHGVMVNGTPRNIITRQEFDFLGRLIRTVDGNDNITHFEYDLQNQMTRQLNPDWTSVNVSYDTPNNQITVTYRNAQEQDVRQIRRNHDQLGQLTAVYAHDGTNFVRLGSFEYDNIGRRITETAYRNPARNSFVRERFEYDALDRIIARETFNNNTRLDRVTFDYAVDATSAFGVRNRRVTTTYRGDAAFRHPTTVSIIDTKGRTVSTSLHRPAVVPAAANQLDRTDNTYDFVGNLLTTTGYRARRAGTNTARMVYNHMNQPIRMYNAYGHYRTLNYDRIGRLVSESDFYGRLTHYTYDNAGRLLQVRTPFAANVYSETRNYFDANGNLIRTMQQNNRQGQAATFTTVEHAYDSMNRLIRVTQHDGTNRYITQYAFDDGFNLTRVFTGLIAPINPASVQGVQANFAVHQYVYDRLGRLVEYIDPMGQRERYEHDLFGNVTRRTNRDGSFVTATFNAFSQPLVIRAHRSNGTLTDSITNTYSVNGLRTRMVDATGTTTYAFDQLGRLSQESRTSGGQPVIIRYTHAVDGARTSFEVTFRGAVTMSTTYQHDRLGRLTHVNNVNGNAAYQHNRNGRITRREVDGIVSTFTYNHAGLLTHMRVATGQPDTSFNRQLTYNLDGNISDMFGWNNRWTDTVSAQYWYDGLGRLTWSHEGSNVAGESIDIWTGFQFDARGNRIEQNRNGVITTYTYDINNRLLTEERDTCVNLFFYDLNGNMTGRWFVTDLPEVSDEAWTFQYDGFNRLTSAQNDGMIATYRYDGNNLRQSKTVNGNTLNHIWDGMHIVKEHGHDSNGTQLNATYIRSTQLMFGMVNGDMQRYVFDHNGSVLYLLDRNRNVRQHYIFDAFGNQMNEIAQPTHNPFRFRGDGYWDAETGFVYLRNRYMDPSLGRFINEDPIRCGLNWFVYAANNPIMFTDPTGLSIRMSVYAFEMFQGYANDIWGGSVTFHTEPIYYAPGVRGVLVYGIKDGTFEGGSAVGRALLTYLIEDTEVFRLVFNPHYGVFDSYYDNRTMVVGLLGAEHGDIPSIMIHEAVHAFTQHKGYNTRVRQASNFNSCVERGFVEAAAISVEERFRYEMGFATRASRVSPEQMIGVNAQGVWPWMANHPDQHLTNPVTWRTNALGMADMGVTLHQSVFLWHRITYGPLGQ